MASEHGTIEVVSSPEIPSTQPTPDSQSAATAAKEAEGENGFGFEDEFGDVLTGVNVGDLKDNQVSARAEAPDGWGCPFADLGAEAFGQRLTSAAQQAAEQVAEAGSGARTAKAGMEKKAEALSHTISAGFVDLRTAVGQQFQSWLKVNPKAAEEYKKAGAGAAGSKTAAKNAFRLQWAQTTYEEVTEVKTKLECYQQVDGRHLRTARDDRSSRGWQGFKDGMGSSDQLRPDGVPARRKVAPLQQVHKASGYLVHEKEEAKLVHKVLVPVHRDEAEGCRQRGGIQWSRDTDQARWPCC